MKTLSFLALTIVMLAFWTIFTILTAWSAMFLWNTLMDLTGTPDFQVSFLSVWLGVLVVCFYGVFFSEGIRSNV